jgi:hypothetical protein
MCGLVLCLFMFPCLTCGLIVRFDVQFVLWFVVVKFDVV